MTASGYTQIHYTEREQRSRHATRFMGYLTPASAVALCIGLILSFSAWYAATLREDRIAQEQFNASANGHVLILRNGIREHIAEVGALRALFQSSDLDVSRKEFMAFSKFLLRDYPAMLAVSWIPRVARDERIEHERNARSEGLEAYTIKSVASDGHLSPAPEADEYFPVLYSTEEDFGSPIYGLNINDGGVRQRALERARDRDGFTTSASVRLQVGDGDRAGFFVLLPVYRPGLPHDTVGERQRNVVGFVQGVFQISSMIESILKSTVASTGLDLYFYRGDAIDDTGRLYFHSSRARSTPVDPLSRTVLMASPHWSADLPVGDRQWTFIAAPIPGGIGTAQHLGSWAALAGCLLVTALGAGYIWTSGHHARRLETANSRLDAAINNMSHALLMFDASERLVVANRRYNEMYRLPAEAAARPGVRLRELLTYRQEVGTLSIDPEAYIELLRSTVARGETCEQIAELSDGRTIAVISSPMAGGGWVATHEDITERRHAERKIAYMARHDALTDMSNRLLFREQLEAALLRAKRGEQIAVLCLDLDHFKSVNDTLGHPIGDVLLKAAAVRLYGCLRETDVVARLGGDEFAVVQSGLTQPTDATTLAARLIEVISAPYDLEGHQAVIGMSIGIAIAPDDGVDPDQLLKNADLALYRAKADGRGVYRFFEADMDARMQARRTTELDLRKAIGNGEFELFYQPLVEMQSDRVKGFEALLRWWHPQRGLISPADFIPLAEETGLIVGIGEWVLRQACREASTWPRDVSVAVNLSPIQFRNKNLVPAIVAALASSELSPSRLEVEITEAVLLQDSGSTLVVLHQLRDLGVRISMDDFGTGYSSLSYLRKFPFDKIKIDQSFIHDMSDRDDSLAIVRAVMAMGISLGIVTTAEGVENVDQLNRLRAEGCTEAQGYFFGPPRPASKVREVLARLNPPLKAIA